jgi:hypothetical protein
MARSNDQPTTSAVNGLLPPEERFWQRYSPRHEALLAAVGSLTLHGLVIGIPLVLGSILGFLWILGAEAQPPNMDLVQVVGEGDGAGGGDPAPLGDPGNDQESAVKAPVETTPAMQKPEEMFPVVPSEKAAEIPEAVTEKSVEPKDNVDNVLQEIRKDVKKIERPKVAKTVARTAPAGVASGQVGGKGLGGSGGGTGTGTGRGDGPGKFGISGQPTKQQIFAQRWRFDMSGNGREHAAKLAAAGVILIVYDQFGNSGVVRDLRRRPTRPVPENLVKFKEAVQWTNNKQDSLAGLAEALQLGFRPIAVQILLPKEREEKMAEAEAAYARKQGRPFDRITETWFDFRLVNGRFEPVVIRQN